jgi:methyltransferase-like protein/ubiquinone/menaquinone biosynthesis C-methylase UbiE
MAPRPIGDCRVLEIGCASGGNIVPMAYELPTSRFVGIDLSAQQIASGQGLIKALGLTNIDLRELDLLDLPESLGTFDYIIAHGVYSWVPGKVQEKLLDACRWHLAPQGVAYVSYNTYPGWHFRGMIRDMMLYHTEQFAEASAQAVQARALLDFLAQSAPQDSAYGIMLRSEVEQLRPQPDAYLLHDHLEKANDPVYFYEFAERAGRTGLKYLAEADFSIMFTGNLPAEVAQTLTRISTDIIRIEQYMDFVRNRQFRQTLLCHKDVVLNRHLEQHSVKQFLIASPAKSASERTGLWSGEPETFAHNKSGFKTGHPLVRAAFHYLGEIWPRTVSFESLYTIATERCGADRMEPQPMSASDRNALARDLLSAYSAELVEFHVYQPAFTTELSETPKASALAREQAKMGRRVTNLRHEMVDLDDFSRHALLFMDGHSGQEAIIQGLIGIVQKGILKVDREGQPITEPGHLKKVLSEVLENIMPKLAKRALLEA